MALIRIEGGCIEYAPDQWVYIEVKNAGVFTYQFVSMVRPKIGDSINTDTNTLIVNTEPIINNDPGFQSHKYETRDVWGQ